MRADSLGMFWLDEPPKPKERLEKPKRTPPEQTWLAADYLPGLEEARAFNLRVMNDSDLMAAQRAQEPLMFDIECYPNYFLAGFTSLRTGMVCYFEMTNDSPLDVSRFGWVLHNFLTVGFNSNSYDLTIAALALAGKSCEVLKHETSQLIMFDERGQDILRKHKVKRLQVDHVDLIEVAPLRASLKIYGGRLHTPSMQDLPFHPDVHLNEDQMAIVRWYCLRKDLTSTAFLRTALDEQLTLRATLSNEYGIDLRSKSDAQIAESVIADEVGRMNGRRPQRPTIDIGTSYRYQIPHFIRFQSDVMVWTLDIVRNAWFVVDDTGSIGLPPELKELKICIAGGEYRMGIGGLHSSEKTAAHFADDHTLLIDRDVTSYYPFIILNLGLYPQHLGPNFLHVYRSIVDRRIAAKERGDMVVSDSLKITINGSFGKLGSKYSVLYAPDLLIQVTITGQLSLLMLIERLELAGISVVSANTDGIVIKCPKHLEATMDAVVMQWEQDTQFNTEASDYLAIFSRDVNNYIAVKAPTKKNPKPSIKAKGAYSRPGLQKNPTGEVCLDALEALLTQGTPIETTIRECKDIRKFVSVRTVKGGAVKIWGRVLPDHETKQQLLELSGFVPVEGGDWRHPTWKDENAVASIASAYEHAMLMWPTAKQEYLGKAIRWYYAAGEEGEIVYASNGNKVPKSDGARPIMDLGTAFPDDIDYDRYIHETERMLKDIGYAP